LPETRRRNTKLRVICAFIISDIIFNFPLDEYLLDQNNVDEDFSIQQRHKKLSKEELQIMKIRKNQKLVSIKAIEFDWIFDDRQGNAFLSTLLASNNLELFSISTIQF
jgi:hypothetical protein